MRILTSAGELLSTDEPLYLSSVISDIGRRAHEQAFDERVAETQEWVTAARCELK